ncbi:MAG: DUF4434 domain-containing protein, partial [Oscillospiraceae bacterium]|jgi:hypothetical protein|nr:DUF4434 domain-containing protein [Oscillospiraceae bacterium]
MLLIQSTVDVEIPWGTYSLYPSELPESAGWQMTDQLEYAFESCRKYGIKLMLGTYNDSKWFEYGWGPPGDLREFLAENTRISNLIVSEITEKYLNRYENEFAGWYFYSEIWNIDVSAPEYWEEYADILSGNFNAWTQHMSAVTPGKPLMISSFYNPQLYNASPEKHSEFWQRIFSMTDFRSGDIFAPQDGAGANPYTFPVLDEWTAALKSAADTEPGLIFWSNNENFTESMTPQDVSRFVQQLEITDKYAEKHICFSWNHYYSPTYGNGIYSAYNDKYQEYVRTGTVPE